MKRFWRAATVVQADGLYSIHLDARPMRLPGGPVLAVAQRGLADAIAAEWQVAGGDVGGSIDYAQVPLTRLAGTAQMRVAPNPTATITALARYAETDCLCYRAATPEVLARRQQAAWDPWLDWAAVRFGGRLVTTDGVVAVAQPAEALAALRDAVAAHDAFGLAGLGILVPAYGSLVLGLAVAEGALSAAAALDISVLEELFQEEMWGEDPDGLARRAHVLRDVEDAARFLGVAAQLGGGTYDYDGPSTPQGPACYPRY